MKTIFKSKWFFLMIIILLIGCKENKDWEKACSLNTISDYEKFIKDHPTSEHIFNAKDAINKIHLQGALDYMITDFSCRYAGISREWNPSYEANLRAFPPEEIRRLIALGYDSSYLPVPSGIDIKMDGGENKIPKGGTYKATLWGKRNHEITICEGYFGIKDGHAYIGDGTKITIDDTAYEYKDKRLQIIK